LFQESTWAGDRGNVVILSARYGTGLSWMDVTSPLSQALGQVYDIKRKQDSRELERKEERRKYRGSESKTGLSHLASETYTPVINASLLPETGTLKVGFYRQLFTCPTFLPMKRCDLVVVYQTRNGLRSKMFADNQAIKLD